MAETLARGGLADYSGRMLITVFHMVSKRIRDPEIKRPDAERAKSFALFVHFREQARQGVPLSAIKPADGTPPTACKELLRGTGIHFEMLMCRRSWEVAQRRGSQADDILLQTIPRKGIDNPYLPPRVTFFS